MTPLTSEQQELAADPRHLGAARVAARKAARRYPAASYDDLESAAFTGLVHAARTFDPARGVKFTTYLGLKVVGAIIDFAREQFPRGARRWNIRESPVKPPGTRHLSQIPDGVLRSLRAREAAGPPNLLGDWIDAAPLRAHCSPQSRVVAYLYLVEGWKMHEIGGAIGLKESRISEILAGFKTDVARLLGAEPGREP